MQSRTVIIIDDEKNKALSEASLHMFHAEFKGMPIYDWPAEEDLIAERICGKQRFHGQENIVYATGLSATSILSKVANKTFHSPIATLSPCLIISIGEEYKEIDKMALPSQLRGMRLPVIHVSYGEGLNEYANILNYFYVEAGNTDGKHLYYVEQSRHHKAGKVEFKPLESPALARMNLQPGNATPASKLGMATASIKTASESEKILG